VKLGISGARVQKLASLKLGPAAADVLAELSR